MLTRSLLAWDLTGEATSLAYINLVIAVPMIFASLLGGAITDRVERRKLVIIGQSLIVINEVFTLSLLLLGQLEFWHMLCTAFVAGCAFPFIMPARMAITMNVVGPKRLQAAMAYQGGAMNLNRVLGPAIMGIIIAQYSFSAAFYLSTFLYLCAIFCMFHIEPSYSKEKSAESKPLLADIGHGFKYIRQNRPVLICLLFGLLPMFLAMPFQNILVVLAEEAWQARVKNSEDSVHLKTFMEIPKDWDNKELAQKWDLIRDVRKVVTGALEIERAEKRIGSSLQAKPTVYLTADAMAALEGLDAADIFITSGVTLIQSEPPANSFMLEDVAGVGVVQNSADGVKCERCWKILPEVSLNNEPVCNRCAYSLKFAPFKFAPAHDPHD